MTETRTPVLRIGDRMRMSVELIQQLWNQESLGMTVVVEVLDVREEHDHTKTLVLTRSSVPQPESWN